ncbi:MAG: ROK family protein [Actinomycetota bacterium]
MIAAIDLGGTRTKCGIVDDGSVIARSVFDTPASARDALERAFKAVNDLDEEFERVGLCVPGLVDEQGVVVSLPGKLDGIEGLPLPKIVKDALGADAVVCNDAVAYGIAEASCGAGRSANTCVVATIGTGVGVTALVHGLPVTTGALGGGLLGGFIPISETSNYTDSNGGRNTIEALCCAQRIVDRANESGGNFETVTDVYSAFESSDPSAIAGVERYKLDLVRALVALAHAHAPDVLVLGGGPLTKGNPLMTGIEETINEKLFGTYRVRVRAAELGDDAALIGLDCFSRKAR